MTEAERRGKAKAAMTSNPNILVICNAYVGHARVFQKKIFFSFPILALFIVNNMEKYSHTQKISSKS